MGVGKGGRKLSYTAKVQGNGNLLVGKAYTAKLDLEPGDEFEIKLGKKQVRLIPVGKLLSTLKAVAPKLARSEAPSKP